MKKDFVFAIAFALLASPVWAAGGYKVVPLVSDQAGVAPVTDTDLVNPWGAAQLSDGAPIWVSDNGTAKSTFYDRINGTKETPIVAIPHGLPTGVVAVPTGINFQIQGGRSYFLFDSISGAITGWVPAVDNFNALIALDNSANGSVYTGLALDATNKHLLAADFVNNQVEIYDQSFAKIGHFEDHDVPKTYGPFNVAVLNGKVYVAYAKKRKPGGVQRGIAPVERATGKGFVDIFALDGTFQTRLVSGAPLNAPWGMAIAPQNFGSLAGALLVGNFGNGGINAFDKDTGASLGPVVNKHGKPIKIDGLWALDPGPGKAQVQFTAGPVFETHGLIGAIKPN
ncbi:MAG TPA: TIGR03118 family protein [Rhizomicrobium sp.]|nr:TIGR03118 family protein [Rhizomicrobium sp.]